MYMYIYETQVVHNTIIFHVRFLKISFFLSADQQANANYTGAPPIFTTVRMRVHRFPFSYPPTARAANTVEDLCWRNLAKILKYEFCCVCVCWVMSPLQ